MKRRVPPRDYSDDGQMMAYSFGFPEKGKRRGAVKGHSGAMGARFAKDIEAGLSSARTVPKRRKKRSR